MSRSVTTPFSCPPAYPARHHAHRSAHVSVRRGSARALLAQVAGGQQLRIGAQRHRAAGGHSESLAFSEQLRALADAGRSTLLIDHDMGLVLGICDRVVVLEFGRVIADGPPEQVRSDPAAIAAYLGGGWDPERVELKD